jgi:hypothetical protein
MQGVVRKQAPARVESTASQSIDSGDLLMLQQGVARAGYPAMAFKMPGSKHVTSEQVFLLHEDGS